MFVEPNRNKRVLYKNTAIEDDDRITDPLAEDLRHQSHAVDIAHDGLAGWEFARAATYSLPATSICTLSEFISFRGRFIVLNRE